MVRIKKDSQSVEKLDIKINETGYGTIKLQKLNAQKEKLLADIEELKIKYFETMEEMGTNNQVVTVFVLFRSMEGVERALYAFKSNKCTRMWFSLFTCCMSKKQKSKLFKGKWIKVQPAVEPELLLWENFGVSQWGRFVRVMLYVIFVLVMLIVCFYIISYLEGEQNHYENELSGS